MLIFLQKILNILKIYELSLAFDIQLPWGLTASVEGSYNKTINNIDVKNVNVGTATGQLEGADNRLIFNSFPTDSNLFWFHNFIRQYQ